MWNRSKLFGIPYFLCFVIHFGNSDALTFQSGKVLKDVFPVNSRNPFSSVNAENPWYLARAKRSPTPQVIKGSFYVHYDDSVSKTDSKTYYFPYQFSPDQCWAIELCVRSDSASPDAPLLVVGRQSVSTMAMNVPQTFRNTQKQYTEVCRTLCPLANFYPSIPARQEEFDVEITTKSPNPVKFTLWVSNITNFILRTEQVVSVNITASTPSVFEYHMPDHIHSILVHVTSENAQCMVVAVQDIKCPLYDTERTAEYEGFYQTVTYQGGITLTRKTFKSGKVYIVMLLKPTDEDCCDSRKTNVKDSTVKEVTLTALLPTTDDHFYIAIFVVLGVFVLLYILAAIICWCVYLRTCKEYKQTHRGTVPLLVWTNPLLQSYGSMEAMSQASRGNNDDIEVEIPEQEPLNLQQAGTSRSIHDTVSTSDGQEGEDHKDSIRSKEVLYVADLCRKKEKRLKRMTGIYSWNSVAIALFYGLPVIQLVLINQGIVNITGNQDLCYYNFLCSYQLWIFSDFNHIYSNIGYCLLGILFLLLVWFRAFLDRHYPRYSDATPQNQRTGIVHHSGILYAMGWALIMEGVLSASYHICPNRANFQFDTTFMYVIATLSMLQLYYNRHPDITPKSYSTWMFLGIVIFIGVFGVFQGGIPFWVVFAVCHIFATFIISTSVYYMWTLKFDISKVERAYQNLKLDIVDGCCKPNNPERFILVFLAVIANLCLDIWGFISRPENYPFFLLVVFIVNFFLYLACYLIMKVKNKERIHWIPAVYILCSVVMWGAALSYFVSNNTQWEMTPAVSREKNTFCGNGNFYDEHDIWHFTSSCALFLSFMGLLTLDDDLNKIPRNQIVVF